MFDLTDARVLVVGGSSGIGLAVAELAAAQGAKVVIAGRSAEKLADAVRVVGDRAEGRPIDITTDLSVEAFFAAGETWDHVVVTAAAFRSAPVKTQALDEAYAAMNSKFWGSYRIARHATIVAGGSLTLVSGAAARRPGPGRAMIAAAASAVETLARGLAVELAPVRVNCVSPGLIDTPMLRASRGVDMAEVAKAVTRVGRVGEAREVALQILACMGNGYMTGAVIDVDGGFGRL